MPGYIYTKSLFLALLILPTLAFAQLRIYNHPELDWKTIDTEHFAVTYHTGLERSAAVVASVAEEIYSPITALYNLEPPNPVQIIVKDTDDISNGAAYFYDNKIVIWALPMDYDLRGTHNWLRDVVTHEFTHIVSMQASMKLSRKIPGFYFQWLGYEREKRDDVVRGFPDAILSYPYSGITVPVWFAEGIAQYNTNEFQYDFWDSHRDMLLRERVLHGNLLSLDEMGVFGKSGIGNESSYNQGYSFCGYIARRFGEKSLYGIAGSLSAMRPVSISSAIRKATGVDGDLVYADWKAEIESLYLDRTDVIRKNTVAGKVLNGEGAANLFPAWSPGNRRIAYISSKKHDYFSETDLFILDVETRESDKIAPGVNSTMSWAPDGEKLVFARTAEPDKRGSVYYDLFIYDFDKKKERRLTHGGRGRYPDWSPDGGKIAYVVTELGSSVIMLYDVETGSHSVLAELPPGRQAYMLDWSPDGASIVFATSTDNGRDLALIDSDGSDFRILLGSRADERNPTYSPDGSRVYFASDETGIYNIYSIDLDSADVQQWTNVAGGALMPAVSDAGEIAYTEFDSVGYRLCLLDPVNPVDSSRATYKPDYPGSVPAAVHDDSHPQEYESRPYDLTFSSMFLFPRVVYDYGTVKIGAYFYSSEVLDKFSIIGGYARNRDGDYDAYARLEYRFHIPTLFIEGYNLAQNISDTLRIPGQDVPIDVKFNLLETTLGFSLLHGLSDDISLYFTHSRYSAAQIGFLTLDDGDIFKYTLSYDYYRGNSFSARWRRRSVPRTAKRYVAPSAGFNFDLSYHRKYDDFITDFAVNEDFNTLEEVYGDYNYNQLDLAIEHYLSLPLKSSLALRLDGGYISKNVDDFLYYFAGGILGLKGYSYYSIGGEKLAIGTAAVRFPLLSDINKRLFQVYFRDLYAGVFAHWGNAWTGDAEFDDFKSSIGYSIRLGAFSYYAFPTAVEFQGAYGLNEFDDALGNRVGGEWRYYFTLLFDFL